MNPMEEFKKSFTKEFEIQGKKFLFRSLSTKETEQIEREISKRATSINDDSTFSIRKIETLASSLVSVNGIVLKQFENIQIGISKGENERELIKEEIASWEDSFTSLLFLYYLDMIKQKDQKYEKELSYLNTGK